MGLWSVFGDKFDPGKNRVVLKNGRAVMKDVSRDLVQLSATEDVWEKKMLFNALVAAGETVDYPMDYWGWDPYKLYKLRQTYGYTWVPSALMANVPTAPGISMPGGLKYDAENPPEGAILIPPVGVEIVDTSSWWYRIRSLFQF